MSNQAFIAIVFLTIGTFAYLMPDTFVAVGNFLDNARCTIGMDYYCKGNE